jgi:hypothetical protein
LLPVGDNSFSSSGNLMTLLCPSGFYFFFFSGFFFAQMAMILPTLWTNKPESVLDKKSEAPNLKDKKMHRPLLDMFV